MLDTREIRRMIATATIGDGDQVLNILEKICDKLDEITRHDAGNCEVCAAQYEADAIGAIPTVGHETKSPFCPKCEDLPQNYARICPSEHREPRKGKTNG